jgi:hypothetical protein
MSLGRDGGLTYDRQAAAGRDSDRKERAMSSTSTALSHRDRAVLRAVAAGRCMISAGALVIDGLCCSDQFVGPRLTRAGLIASGTGPAHLTAAGLNVLAAA